MKKASVSFRRFLRTFIPLALGLSAVLGISYVNDQQILRESANEPQKGMAEDLANQLSTDATAYLTTAPHVAIESSALPYLVAYDSFGQPEGGTGYLDGGFPTLPSGVFDAARGRGENLITWMPRAGVRSAIVVVPVNNGAGGYVMGGKSLKFTEQQESQLTERFALGWLALMLITALGVFVFSKRP